MINQISEILYDGTEDMLPFLKGDTPLCVAFKERLNVDKIKKDIMLILKEILKIVESDKNNESSTHLNSIKATIQDFESNRNEVTDYLVTHIQSFFIYLCIKEFLKIFIKNAGKQDETTYLNIIKCSNLNHAFYRSFVNSASEISMKCNPFQSVSIKSFFSIIWNCDEFYEGDNIFDEILS